MAVRKAISKKARFEIFKRDGFTCQYCGAHPPKAILQVDHIAPVAEGGGNEDTNLVTSCDHCNLGKGAVSLSAVPQSLSDRATQVQEREAQLKGYSQAMAAVRKRIENDAWTVAEIFMAHFRKETIRRDWLGSITNFIEKLGDHECIRAMERAVVKRPHSEDQAFRYFCGICWNIVREGE